MNEKIILTESDYERLIELAGFTTAEADILRQNLSVARKIPKDKIGNAYVTMNSRVLLKELKSGRNMEISLTYPRDAQPSERKVSVLSPIGLALLGRKERDVVSWRIPTGVGKFEIVKVTYQPEAAGDFAL